jgi:predicted transcriptional regulator
MYLERHHDDRGNNYGSIAFDSNMKKDEVEAICQVLNEHNLAEFKNDCVFITDKGKQWIEDYIDIRDDRIREYVYTNYEFALLRFVAELDAPLAVDDFPEVLKEQAPTITRGSATMQLIQHLAIKWRSYFQSPKNKYSITKEGKKRYEFLAKELRVSTSHSASKNEPGEQHFSKSDITEINDRLDAVQEMIKTEFEKILISQQFTYDDIMAELNELREYTGLPKKIFRQLTAGKLAEMLVSGVIGATLSQRIADQINPAIDKLLQ